MLKIKDNVDLKELENFGFKYAQTNMDKYLYVYYLDNEFDLTIYENDKILRLGCCPIEDTTSYADTDYLDILFDIIQNGLVEKVVRELDEK